MPATKIIGQSISRRGWGVILLGAAFFAVTAALALEALGLGSSDLGPLSFVSAVVMVKLGLFTFWPVLAEKGAEASTVIHAVLRRTALPEPPAPRKPKAPRPNAMQLWDERDPRIDITCFNANVPTFVLSHEQRFLDWNPAFALVFGHLPGMRRGAHVGVWYEHLDNFRRVAKRTEKLYGEGILPLTDRERITFVSKEYGRMVFTRLMTPIIDRDSARIVGWNVVLNVNSVNKREAFFERMFGAISAETRRVRHVAAFDGLVLRHAPYRRLLELHRSICRDAYRVLDVAAQTGNLTQALLEQEHKVTAVDSSTQQLRKLRAKCEAYADRLRIVRRDPSDLSKLPEARFDAAVMMLAVHKVEEPVELFKNVLRSLVPGGVFSVSIILPDSGLDGMFGALRESLVQSGAYDALKHQYGHVLEHERELALAMPYRFHSREDVRAYLLEAGFSIEEEHRDLLGGHALMVVARKP